jgi:3-methyladenine DNA glycosylase/8-oxoguanine DNA glycosylase
MTGPMTAADLERARRTLMRRDPRLGALIKRVGRCGLADARDHDPFVGLIRVIMSQQLSGKAADTIFGRVADLTGGEDNLTPARVLDLEDPALRSAGVSRSKVAYVKDLAARVADGRLEFLSLEERSDEDVIDALTAVKGLGRWSAEMYLMFRLNRPDVWPIGDLGIVKGVQALLEMKRMPARRTLERTAKPWRPYRSVAAWYLWRI